MRIAAASVCAVSRIWRKFQIRHDKAPLLIQNTSTAAWGRIDGCDKISASPRARIGDDSRDDDDRGDGDRGDGDDGDGRDNRGDTDGVDAGHDMGDAIPAGAAIRFPTRVRSFS
jgi:hypothetical protein